MLDDPKLREVVIGLLRTLKKTTLTENLKMLYDNFYPDGIQQSVFYTLLNISILPNLMALFILNSLLFPS